MRRTIPSTASSLRCVSCQHLLCLPCLTSLPCVQDLEALLEALHRSRQENKDLAESVKQAEERCSKLTREYERLVAKVQEEGYFLRAKEREKLRKAVQDLQDYEVYKQVMEAAMSKMQVELDLLIKENKVPPRGV